jgi:hypothetical protein
VRCSTDGPGPEALEHGIAESSPPLENPMMATRLPPILGCVEISCSDNDRDTP